MSGGPNLPGSGPISPFRFIPVISALDDLGGILDHALENDFYCSNKGGGEFP